MSVIICPGIHESSLTQSFVKDLLEVVYNSSDHLSPVNILKFPVNNLSVLSGFHIWQFLHENLVDELESPVVLIGFSAGVVGAIAAANFWQMIGGNVKAFIAIDGWMVPMMGNFPIYRMSHDYFTHWSSCLLGSGDNNFYAQPAVEHLEIWRSPSTVEGYWVNSKNENTLISLTAAEFIKNII
ncbi:MAG: hypothetical protein HC836_19900 [Richelia sp. RM2_1_2]|nr:hypothetical protein [Richelia sp. SM2_1_7]NJM18393.1 hypothetical protein [Richelia sp. SM1_7_0]NJN07293.1 hypothetical protein [Richelia sp. RM1_1_1]NJO30655.1 hypothetical protein [Richelia sp. SL_2_1]NJO60446.1 hypothetical protein [Richelia sp. RM2_1_2]